MRIIRHVKYKNKQHSFNNHEILKRTAPDKDELQQTHINISTKIESEQSEFKIHRIK